MTNGASESEAGPEHPGFERPEHDHSERDHSERDASERGHTTPTNASTVVPAATHAIPVRSAAARPLHVRPAAMLVVFIGGAAGTLCRFLIAAVVPPLAHVPVATLLVNVVGAFLLGMLLGGIARRGVESRRGRVLRLLIGTGFMGGFTTYSTLAVETSQFFGSGHGALGAAYSIGTLVVGLGASIAGIALGGAITRPRAGRS